VQLLLSSPVAASGIEPEAVDPSAGISSTANSSALPDAQLPMNSTLSGWPKLPGPRSIETLTAAFRSCDKEHPATAVSTIGAEKRAPPGMGKSPMRAGITTLTVEASWMMATNLSTIRSNWPETFIS